MTNQKGQGLSINLIVVIALAVFVIFLVIGFVTGGFGYFAQRFEGAKGEPLDIARANCLNACVSYKSASSPAIGAGDVWDNRLKQVRTDVDFDGDGTKGGAADTYTCRGTLPSAQGAVLSNAECVLN